MKSILDPSFRYTSSLQTDVRKTFERVRRELERENRGPTQQALGRVDVLAEQRWPADARVTRPSRHTPRRG